MGNNFSTVIIDLPITGGLSGDPSVLPSVEDFLSKESHLRKANQILEEDGCVVDYLPLIDCLLVELRPDFEKPCSEFYEGNGKPLASLHPAETIKAIDVELVIDLEVLISKEWLTWADFKSNFKAEIKWEPL